MNPAQFIDEVSAALATQLQEGITELKAELVKIATSKNSGDVSEGRLEEACQLIHERAKAIFEKNMDKFRIYSMRNIFVPVAPGASSSSSKTTSTETDAQLTALREQYLSLQAENRVLADSCRDTDLLLKDMRAALFTLRVGAQAFDDGDIQPIAETVGNITQNREKLLQLCAEANEIIGKIAEHNATGSEEMDVVEPQVASVVIETRDVEDIALLGKSLRGK